MLFSSTFFIFLFLPLFLCSYFLTPKKFRNITLLFASLGFYAWGEPTFCFIAIASALFDYMICKKVNTANTYQIKRLLLFLGIGANLALLIYFKYSQFFLNAFQALTHKSFDALNILLPIGISFIVFEKITYLVDVYRGHSKPAANVWHYLTYVFLFPKLLAGPIIKYHEIVDQLNHRQTSLDDFMQGFKRFIRGLAKKVFIADVCGVLANDVFALSADELSFGYAWLGIICFTIQIYFDFSGYSDMALGLARMLGFNLKENFNMPYIAENFTEFWRRWHISLSTWIREYLYIPLGGNRASSIRVYTNLWICFLLSGLWHGANWTFVAWGAFHGFFLAFDKFAWLKWQKYLPRIARIFLTLFLIMLSWVIFRANDFTQVNDYMKALFHPNIVSTVYIDVTKDFYFAIILGMFISLFPAFKYFESIQARYYQLNAKTALESFTYGLLGLFILSKIVAYTYTPFLYFKF